MRVRGPGFLLALAVFLSAAPPVDAHALGAQCTLKGDKVELESYYDDDTPARNAKVRVENGEKSVVAEGHTDTRGQWTFSRPRPGRYTVVVDAGAGHRTQFAIVVPEGESSDLVQSSDDAQPDAISAVNTEPITISEGPTRSSFTSIPWLKIGLGLAVIGALGLTFWLVRRANHLKPRGDGS